MLGRLQLAFDQAVYPQDATSMAWQSDIPCANFTLAAMANWAHRLAAM
jgi:hypothetical protein